MQALDGSLLEFYQRGEISYDDARSLARAGNDSRRLGRQSTGERTESPWTGP